MHIRLLTIFLTLCFVYMGCSLHKPEKITLSATIPEKFNEKRPSHKTQALPDQWWEAFGDENLNGLMAEAFSENLDLAVALARLKQIEAVARKSGAARLPQVNIKGNGGWAEQVVGTGTETGNSYGLSVAAGYEVDLFNKLKSRAQARELEARATVEEIRTLYLSLSAQIVDFYYLMVEQRAQLILIDQTVAARKSTLELIERSFREGMVPALDLYRARQNLASVRSRRPDIEASLASTAYSLSILLGRYPDATIAGDLAVFPDLPKAYPSGLPSHILARRPDISADLLRLSASDLEIGAAVADRFPSINLLADYGYMGSDFGTSVSATVWSLMGNLTLPLLDWGGRKAEVERNRAVFEERLNQYRLTVLKAFQEVEEALVKNRTSTESIKRIEIEATAANAMLRLSLDRYMDGLSDYLPVLDARTRHLDAQVRLLSSKRKLISARISLARAIGGNWMNADVEKRIKGEKG